MTLGRKMMINLFLVDDEQIICQGIRTTIKWEQYSIKVVGEAHNGVEALEKIENDGNIDIILLDVMMPKMDGLELAEHLQELENTPKIIMVSGYDEFEYAKRALRLGVKDYLLKPVDIDELLKTVQKITTEIIQEKDKIREYQELLVTDLIKKQISGRKVDRQGKESDLKIYPLISSSRSYHYFTQSMSIEELKYYEEKWKENINNTLRNLSMKCISFFIDKNILITIIYKWRKAPSRSDLINIFNKMRSKDNLYFVFGELIPIRDFSYHYSIIKNVFNYATITRKKYFFHNDLNSITKLEKSYSNKRQNEINDAFFSSEKERLLNLINELFIDFEQLDLFLDQVFEICRGIITMIIDTNQQIMPYNQMENIRLKFLKDSSGVNILNSYRLLKEVFLEDIIELYDDIMGNKKEDNWKIIRMLKYINEYYNHDIKAYEVADYINISPNYFSTLFKQKIGISFNEYLNKIRVEKAMTLLRETSDQINMISENVGYHEYKYFAQIFKKMTNLTPTEYRNIQK